MDCKYRIEDFQPSGGRMPDARVEFEELFSPECTYAPPPYRFKGVGIALVYEIPFARLGNVIPKVYAPDPGKGKIWFKANVYDWHEFFSLAEPDTKYRYHESCYKFSIRYGSEIGDYPIKLYLDHDVPIAVGIDLYGLQKFPAEMQFNSGAAGTRALIQRGPQTELDVNLEKAKGIAARLTTLIANASTGPYLKKYVGNILYQKEGDGERILYTPTQISYMKYECARPVNVYLREPLEWGILTEAEMAKPKYAFLLTGIEAELGPPRSVSI